MSRTREVDPDFQRMVAGYGLTTAEILYRIPDYHRILQVYIWQEYDIEPEFPRLHRFLVFWQTKLDGPLYQVRVAHAHLIRPREITIVGGEFKIH